MDIYDSTGKRVIITDIDGQQFIGYSAYYTSELDDPDGVASISIEPDGRDDILINFTQDEIASIEVIHEAVPAAQAV